MSSFSSCRSEAHALKCELASDVLRSFGHLRLKVTGSSMLPVIWPGDTLELERIEGAELSIGEIVLFIRDRRLFAHRVLKTSQSAVVTRGDALPYIDPSIAEDELLGRVACIVRDGRRIQPKKKLSITQHAVAGMVRSSDFAGRVVVGIHNFTAK